MKYKHVMVDLETMGTGSDAAIIAIGAVAFNAGEPIQVHTNPSFYKTVTLASSMAAGMTVDASTIMWWLQQSDAARAEFKAGRGVPLISATTSFASWFQDVADTDALVWGNGATFDNVILTSAYRLLGIPRPWSYRADACYRTLRGLLPGITHTPLEGDTHHNALHDARYQAAHCARLLTAIGGQHDADI
jgi:exodeoxyribonuclease VIII